MVRKLALVGGLSALGCVVFGATPVLIEQTGITGTNTGTITWGSISESVYICGQYISGLSSGGGYNRVGTMFCTDILDEIPVPWGPWSATQTQSTDLTNINATWGPSSDGHSASGALPPFATDLTSESTELNEAAYLADAYVGNSIALTGANATDDVAAAYQLAIWQVLYNGLTVTNLSDASVGTAASYLVAEANGQTGSAEYYAAYYYYSGEVPHYGSDPKVSQDFIVGGAAGQGEIVPEPFTVGLGVLALGLAAYRRRRR